MYFVFLDEFGHIGPFIHRTDPKHCTSPIFGMAGVILPEESVRGFSTAFLQLKSQVFEQDILRADAMPQKWEKKGADIFRPKALERYLELRRIGFRLISLIEKFNGEIFYHGREKIVGKMDGNSTGLYTTVFSYSIRNLDRICAGKNVNFALVLDQHAARKELLACASKTMFGVNPARRLLCPPFEVESHLNQPIQAADWLAAILGRLWCFETQPMQYADHEKTRNYFWDRIHGVTTKNSSVTLRRKIDELTGKYSSRRRVSDDLAIRSALKSAGF